MDRAVHLGHTLGMDYNIMWLLAPSLVAGFVGWFVGEAHGFDRAVACVADMPMSGPPPMVDLSLDEEGDAGMWERARR